MLLKSVENLLLQFFCGSKNVFPHLGLAVPGAHIVSFPIFISFLCNETSFMFSRFSIENRSQKSNQRRLFTKYIWSFFLNFRFCLLYLVKCKISTSLDYHRATITIYRESHRILWKKWNKLDFNFYLKTCSDSHVRGGTMC